MTDEERQKMCDDLRRCQSSWLKEAADEIERLATKCNALERDLEWTRERVKALEQRLPLVGVMRG